MKSFLIRIGFLILSTIPGYFLYLLFRNGPHGFWVTLIKIVPIVLCVMSFVYCVSRIFVSHEKAMKVIDSLGQRYDD